MLVFTAAVPRPQSHISFAAAVPLIHFVTVYLFRESVSKTQYFDALRFEGV